MSLYLSFNAFSRANFSPSIFINWLKLLYSYRLSQAVQSWEVFLTAQKGVEAWIRDARALMSVRHVDNIDKVEAHQRFFESPNDQVVHLYLKAAQDLEPFLNDDSKGPLGAEIRKNQEEWTEIKNEAPFHLRKVAFMLDEHNLEKLLQEVEGQLVSESQALQRGEDVTKITQEHVEFFARNALVEKIEGCLANLSLLAAECQHHDPALKESYEVYKSRWNSIKTRMENIFGQLEQIPEQWKVYEIKFKEMSDWMDSVEKSLDNVNKGLSSHEGFLREKQIFQVFRF